MTLVEELERAMLDLRIHARLVPGTVEQHADLLRRAVAMIAALKEETLSLLNKPELPLRKDDWSFGHGRVGWAPQGEGWWLIAVAGQDLIWAKRRDPGRAELLTLTEEK